MLNNNELKTKLNHDKLSMAIDQLCSLFQEIADNDKDYFTYNEVTHNYSIMYKGVIPQLEHEYEPDNGYESITITPYLINDYGVLEYSLILIQYGESGEIITPEILAQDYEESHIERQITKIERENKRDADKHTNIKDRACHFAPGKHLTIKNTIQSRTCYSNITHEHPFKAIEVELITRDLTDIKPLIHLRDLLYAL